MQCRMETLRERTTPGDSARPSAAMGVAPSSCCEAAAEEHELTNPAVHVQAAAGSALPRPSPARLRPLLLELEDDFRAAAAGGEFLEARGLAAHWSRQPPEPKGSRVRK